MSLQRDDENGFKPEARKNAHPIDRRAEGKEFEATEPSDSDSHSVARRIKTLPKAPPTRTYRRGF